jgi:hypothetical protein
MLPIRVDAGDQLRQGLVALLSDVPQAIPKVSFDADTTLVTCNHDRAFDDRRFHGASSPHVPINMRRCSDSIMTIQWDDPMEHFPWSSRFEVGQRPMLKPRYGRMAHPVGPTDICQALPRFPSHESFGHLET